MARPIVLMGGWLSSPADYLGMAQILAGPRYRRLVYPVDFGRAQWAALRDPNFGPALDTLAATVRIALAETGADQVDLIGHSAGGRIARAYLADEPYAGVRYAGHELVASLTTLGTAHATSEIWVKQFSSWLDTRYPGAAFPHVAYRSVAGRSVTGRRWGNPEEILAFRSYEVSFGDGALVGDGIVPTAACYLRGADNLVLEGARHAPYNAPQTWYGAREVIPLWFDG